MNEKKRQLLKDFPWEEKYKNLVAFAQWVIDGKTWKSDVLPKGHTAESIVREVIVKTFSEERNWNPERGDLLIWLKWVIRSEISHLAKSAENQKEVQLEGFEDDGSESNEVGIDKKSRIEALTFTQEDKIIATETIEILLKACNGETELEQIIFAICDGECSAKPQALADYLEKPIEEIYVQLKKLRRKATKIRKEDENGSR